MCRIAGIIDKSSHTIRQDIVSMRDVMHRGGPDSAGEFYDDNLKLGFGHRRLSLIDLSDEANQPMADTEDKLMMVFNGEIYNYLDLREELLKAGYNFRTKSDTEVILNAYKAWGENCFGRLKGMFGLALLDKANDLLFLVRDQVGIKPLYYSTEKNSIYFASEVKAFRALERTWEENHSWKVFFLTYGYLPEPYTTLKNVKPLPRGSYLKINVHTLQHTMHEYYRDDYTQGIDNIEEAKNIIVSSLNKAVERHLIADAPIGLFLSGGVDSSLLTLLAKQYKQNDLHTLSIVFDDKNYSEKHYQDIVVKQSGSQHQYFTLTRELFLEALPDYMKAMDQPSADGINTYFISKYARQSGLKAVISGLGADELLGGYASFKQTGMVNASRNVPGFMYRLADLAPIYKYKKISFLERKDAVGEYLFNRGYFSALETARVLDIDISEVKKLLEKIQLPAATEDLDDGNRASAFESELYMKNQLLKDTDIMSMWHGLEVRVPFLDIDFIKAVHCINHKLKFGGERGKHLLIEAFKDILPQEIWNRRKQGFVFPFRNWIMAERHDAFTCKNPVLNTHFTSGKLDWSRYWSYIISDLFKEGKLN
jgi:asparagine synthase (glutamine-hydrolysing)